MTNTQYLGVLLLAGVTSLFGSSLLTMVVWPDGGIAQQGDQGMIITRGIKLVNDEGETRASLILWDGEHPALVLSDKACARRATISVYPRERA